MKKRVVLLVLGTVLVSNAVFAQDTSSLLKNAGAAGKQSLCAIQCEIEDELGRRKILGAGVCIADPNVIMTLMFPSTLRPEKIKSLQLIQPGVGGAAAPAKFLGLDPVSGLGFIQGTGKSVSLSKVAFVPSSGAAFGKRVVSSGLLLTDPAAPVILGVGYVSSIRYIPDKLVAVTGGALGPIGSVVFNEQGKGIGLVGQQPSLRYQMILDRPVTVQLKGEDQTTYFLPIESFLHVLKDYPRDGKVRRAPWIGVGVFGAISESLASAKQLKSPGVVLNKIIPGKAAAKMGIKEGDVVIGLDGKSLTDLGSPELVRNALYRNITSRKVGDAVSLTIKNDSGVRTVKLTLEPMPKLASEALRFYHQKSGMVLREKVMLDRYASDDPTAKEDGILVTAVGKRSPADLAGLKVDDLIVSISGQRVMTAEDCKKVVDRQVSRNQPIRMKVLRGTEAVMVEIRLLK